MEKFFIPKTEGDYSDVLLCTGIAKIINQVFSQNNRDSIRIWVNNTGSYYLIELERELKDEYFESLSFETLYPVIFYDKMDEPPPYAAGNKLIDFTEEQEYENWSADRRKSGLIRQATGIPLSNKIMDNLYGIKDYFSEVIYTILDFYSQIQKDYGLLEERLAKLFDQIQINNFKQIVKSELTPEELAEIESELENLFIEFDNYHWTKRNKVKKLIANELSESETTNYITENIKELYNQGKIDFDDKHNALSSLLPKRVKGLNSADLSSDSRITPKNTSESWVKLFLILIGFYESFIFKRLQSGNRLYSVIIPNQISLEDFDQIYEDIEPDYYPAETLEKQNILYLSDFVVKLLNHLESFDKLDGLMEEFVVSDYVAGLKNAYLVDMGQNHVIKNIYDLNVPNWVILDEEKDKTGFQKVFKEFIELIRPIDDANEDIKLFQELYKFLTTERVDYLLNYYYQHAILAMQRLGNDEGAKIYTKRSVKFIMSKLEKTDELNYSDILTRRGFKNFAKAIRNSTLVPIYHNDDSKVKFGLLQDLKRASLNKDTLITKLSEFMATYNNENGLESYHNRNPMRANLTTGDFEDMVELIDEYDSKIIGNMLLAYGFGKDEKVEEVKEKEAVNNE